VPTEAPAPVSTNAEPSKGALERVREELARVPPWAWALVFAIVLCLPQLSRFGFWDPWELKLAEQARDIAREGKFFSPSRYPTGHFLSTLLSALGIAIFGPSEFGARLPIALSAIGALMATYWAGRSLLRPRAALLATVALGTMPLFVLEARQLTSDAPTMALLALALGGLARFAWPPDGKRRWWDFAIGLFSMALAELGSGALVGVALPVVSLVAAVAIGYGLVAGEEGAGVEDGTAGLTAPGVGPDIPPGQSFGSSLRAPSTRFHLTLLRRSISLLIVVGLLAAAFGSPAAGKFSVLLGGVPRSGPPTKTFEALIRQLGFGLFPWSAVVIFALARPLTRLDGEGNRTNPRLAFVQLYLLLFAGLGFAVSGYLNIVIGDVRYIALPAMALSLGAFLDEALEGNGAEPVAGLLMGIGTLIIARDFLLTPEELASVHVIDKVRWPSTIQIGSLFMLVGLVSAAGVYGGLAARPRAIGKVPGPDQASRGGFRKLVDRVFLFSGRYGLQIAVACALAFALYLSQILVPHLSTHLSFKPVLESYTKFAHEGDKIGKYRIEGHGSTFYSKQTMVELPSQDRVVQFLRDPARVFAMVPTDELAALDAAFKQAHVAYYVVDASSSRFLLLTNQLASGQRDDNPLLANVWTAPAGDPNAKPPWNPRVLVSATFGDAVELIGADYPTSVRRPGKIPLDLYFRVKAKVPGTYKIFVHFDGPAAPRVIGDHDPVNHAFGTNFWLPDEYVRDHYETDVPLMTTPAGMYTIYFGFWPGGEGKRLKVTQGPNDGADRVRLGTIEIK